MSKKIHYQAYDQQNNHFGMFDGEFLYNFQGEMLLRVDGSEVYNLEIPCKYVANFDKNVARHFDGSVYFKVSE